MTAELRRSLTAYVTVPRYDEFFRWIGFEHEAAEAIAAWNAGDRKKAMQCVSERNGRLCPRLWRR